MRQNSELLFFLINYMFLILNFIFYLNNLPFKKKALCQFFISIQCYFFSNLIILNLFRKRFLIYECDLLPINLIFLILCFKIGEKIYYCRYYAFLLHENKNKKKVLFAIEEQIELYISSKRTETTNFLLLGFIDYNVKHFMNIMFKKNEEKTKILEIKELQNHLDKKFLIEFIFKKFKNLIDQKTNSKYDEGNSEILYAKFISFLLNFLNFGLNPILCYYEIQKALSINKKFSFYFSIFSASIKHEIKNKLKFFLRNKDDDSPNSQIDNTYQEFFKFIGIKKELENNFKNVINNKIDLFEKNLVGFQNLKELFLCNFKLVILIKKFKENLRGLNEDAPFSKIFKYKFLYFLNSLILNKIARANLNEKVLFEYFKSKNENLIDKSIVYDFIGEKIAVCEVSFIDHKGSILEKSKNSKFTNFFGYSNEDEQKISSIHDLMPRFIRNNHEMYISNFIEQKNNTRKFDLSIFALDKNEFVFPILVHVSLKYNQKDDFVFLGAFTKINEFPSKFCLCDMDGEILNISKDLFHEFAKEYEFLKIFDFEYINILQLMPDFCLSLDEGISITSSKNNSCKIFFPKELKSLIDRKKTAKFREKDENSRKLTGTTALSNQSKDFNHFKNINLKNEYNYAEITFNITSKKYGNGDCLIEFLIISIIEFKKVKLLFENPYSSLENINNTTILKKNTLTDQNNYNPNVIHLFENNEKINDHFGIKLNVCHQKLKKETFKSIYFKKKLLKFYKNPSFQLEKPRKFQNLIKFLVLKIK